MSTERAAGWRSSIDIILFTAVVVADAAGYVPLTQTIFQLPLIWLLLRLRGERWSAIGVSMPDGFGRAVAIGVAAGVLMEIFAVQVTTPLFHTWFGVEPDYSDFRDIQGNLALLVAFLALSWTLAAFGEEICFRGFLMKRVAELFGDSRAAWVASLVLSSALFGWGTPSRASPDGRRRALAASCSARSSSSRGGTSQCRSSPTALPTLLHSCSSIWAAIRALGSLGPRQRRCRARIS